MLIRGDRQVAVICCCVYNLSARARYSRGGSHDVHTGWPSHKLFSILFFPLKLELFTFQICNVLKVDIFKNEIKQEAQGPHRSPESYWLIFRL
jgi:hypothetical protein